MAESKVDTSKFRPSTRLGAERQSLPRSRSLVVERDGSTSSSEEISSDSDFEESAIGGDTANTSVPLRLVPPVSSADSQLKTATIVGSGLKRKGHDLSQDSQLPKRARRSKLEVPKLADPSQDSWEGFNSFGDSDDETLSRSTDDSGDSAGTEKEVDEQDEPPSSDYSSSVSESSTGAQARKVRSSAFKTWASQQINEAADFVPSAAPTAMINDKTDHVESFGRNVRPDPEPLPPELVTPSQSSDRKAHAVHVTRSQEVEESRANLPIVAEEQQIMEAIYNNLVVVIQGATGSGKTTQVPQFLYEAGFGSSGSSTSGMIGITQPRRVAAVSMAKRVAEELNTPKDEVSYQIRFDTTVSKDTKIKFMTDGVLVREIAQDFALSKYSIIIIDEAHERSSNTDILIGMVSRIVDLRESMSKDGTAQPLRMVIMSANLRVEDFLENAALFRRGRPPLVQVEGRQFPVTMHFARHTIRDYVDESFHKICKGHRKLPPGGFLVFLTGQDEIHALRRRLQDELTNNGSLADLPRASVAANDAPLEIEDMESLGTPRHLKQETDPFEDDIDIDVAENDDVDFEVDELEAPSANVLILPLFAQLQTKDQLRVFQSPPKDTRLIILATNVAETSITIPGIRYVFDCGRAKSRRYDQVTCIQSFDIDWISKASAAQRAGRAGRTSSGHCYRLYSSAVYERDFEEHAQPEISRLPAEGIVLQLKSMDLQHIANFPFPSPPDRQNLAQAERLLCYLGAISDGKLTRLGRDISVYPLSPRFAKMLAIGHQHDCLPYAIALVAALSTPNIVLAENVGASSISLSDGDFRNGNSVKSANENEAHGGNAYGRAQHMLSANSPTSDGIKVLTALCAYAHALDKKTFCNEMFLSAKALSEASSLFTQLMSLVRKTRPGLQLKPSLIDLSRLPSPSKQQILALQQFITAAFIDQVAILASEHPSPSVDTGRRPSRAIDVPYLPLFPIKSKVGLQGEVCDVAVYLHPSSLLARRAVKDLPKFVVYQFLQQAAPAAISDNTTTIKIPKTRMHPLTIIGGRQLANLARGTQLLEYSKPLGKIEEIEPGKKRLCWVIPKLAPPDLGTLGWSLPAVKVMQIKKHTGWAVEEIIG